MRRRRTIYRHCEKALKRWEDVFQIVLAKRQPPRIRVEVMLRSEMMHSSWQSSKASQFTTEGTFLEVRCEKSFSSLQDQSLLSSRQLQPFGVFFGHLSNSRNERRRRGPSKGQPGLKNELFWTPSTQGWSGCLYRGLFPYIPRAFVLFPSKQIEFYIKVKAPLSITVKIFHLSI